MKCYICGRDMKEGELHVVLHAVGDSTEYYICVGCLKNMINVKEGDE